uniref:Uncharacterized protein n=1 Tax=Arundo donax TaxID=35708 RepID=A0A0A8Y0L2_ARUDO
MKASEPGWIPSSTPDRTGEEDVLRRLRGKDLRWRVLR